MMRRSFVATMVAVAVGLIGMGGLVSDARAGATVDLLFVSRNGGAIAPTSAVSVLPGDTLKLAIRLSHNEATGLILAQFGVAYDTDGDNELEMLPFGAFAPANTLGAVAWGGVTAQASGKTASKFFPISQPSTANQTYVNSFNSAIQPPASGVLPVGSGYQMGTISWTVTGTVNTDGVDITAGSNLFTTVGQDIQRFGSVSILGQTLFNSASVNLIPEPGTAALLGLGLLGIAAVGRRR